MPIKRGNRTVPPSISGTPNRLQNTPRTAVSSMTRKSHHRASSSPPATAWPEMAAMTGLFNIIRLGPMGPSPSGARRFIRRLSWPANAFRSAPAQKLSPIPHNTATEKASSSSNSRKASTSADAVGPSTAFFASGRLMNTVNTLSLFSMRIDILPPLSVDGSFQRIMIFSSIPYRYRTPCLHTARRHGTPGRRG